MCDLSDEIIAYLFTVKPELCGERLELKVNNTRFLAFPVDVGSGEPRLSALAKENIRQHCAPPTLIVAVIFVLSVSATIPVTLQK
jgi:hypothetical protein